MLAGVGKDHGVSRNVVSDDSFERLRISFSHHLKKEPFVWFIFDDTKYPAQPRDRESAPDIVFSGKDMGFINLNSFSFTAEHERRKFSSTSGWSVFLMMRK